MMRLTPVVKNLLILNVGVYFLIALVGESYFEIVYKMMLHPLSSEEFSPYQIFTSMFMHFEFRHVLFNMLGLLFMGPILEMTIGDKKFLLLYLLCGIFAAVAQLAVQYFLGEGGPMIGASGATMGVFLGTALFYPNMEVNLYFLIPVKLKWLALIFLGYDLIQGLFFSGTGVAHFAHLGGALFSILLIYIWKSRRMI